MNHATNRGINRGRGLTQSRARPLLRQRGVAVITALLLTTLAVTIVASLFWQQQVQVRSMENQRLQLQTRWILRGALDWSRLILFQDGVDTAGVGYTSLTGVWATPLAETRLDDYVERERVQGENFDATLSGQLSDAQSRYNLANLAYAKTKTGQLTVFQQLLSNLQIDPGLAQKVADQVARNVPPAGGGGTPPVQPSSGTEPLDLVRVEDLLAVSGFTQQAIERLRDFVIVLPLPSPAAPTPVNVNTAPPELMAALVQNYSVSEAVALSNSRKRIPYRNVADLTPLLNNHELVQGVDIDVKSNFFLAQSRVRLDRATLDTQALLRRDPATHRADVLWIREN